MPVDLTKEFNANAELKKLFNDNDVNILMGGDGITNHMSLQAVLAHDRITKEKKYKKFIERILDLTTKQILEQIRQTQRQITDAIKRMDDVINRADTRIDDIQQTLQDLTSQHNQLNDTIEARYFEKYKDGTYKSQAITDTVAAYEGRKDENIPDDIPPEMLILILQAQMSFEKNTVVPELEHDLVKLHEFRDGIQEQKETFEEENKRIDDALKAIGGDASLSNEERRIKKAEILKDASKTALDAQMTAHSAEQDYVELVEETRLEKLNSNNSLYDEHFEEDAELNQSLLDELQDIKPLLVPSP